MKDYPFNRISAGRSKLQVFVCVLVIVATLIIIKCCDPIVETIIFNSFSDEINKNSEAQ